MAWNYRIIRTFDRVDQVSFYQIHEVFYDQDNNIKNWSENPPSPFGIDLDDLSQNILKFMSTFEHPVLFEKQVDGKPTLVEDDHPDSQIKITPYSFK